MIHMKTRFSISIPATGLLLILSLTGVLRTAAQSKSYVSSDKIFILTYPADWKPNKLETTGEISLIAPGANIFNTCTVKMEIARLAEGYEKFDIRQLSEVELKMLKAQQDKNIQFEILESGFKNIKDHEWWVIKATMTRKKDVYLTNSYKTIHNGKTYVFTYFSAEKNFQKNEAAAYAIFESIEFLTKLETAQKNNAPAGAKEQPAGLKTPGAAAGNTTKSVAGPNETVPAAGIGKTGKIGFMYGGKKVVYSTVRAADGNIWIQQNLGSLQVASAIRDEKAYGDLFQWGRWDDGHQYRVPANTRNAVATPNNPLGLRTTGTNPFFYKGFDNWWSGGLTTDTWTAATPAAVSASDGCDPCKALGGGWHMPAKAEWEKLLQAENITDENGAFMSHLRFPSTTGFRDIDNGILRSNTYGGYWSSTASAAFDFDITNAGIADYYRGIGFSVRCVRNP